MATTKLMVKLIKEFRTCKSCDPGKACRFDTTKFFVYFPNDGDWRERAQLVLDQIMGKIPVVTKVTTSSYDRRESTVEHLSSLALYEYHTRKSQENFMIFSADGESCPISRKIEQIILRRYSMPIEEKFVNRYALTENPSYLGVSCSGCVYHDGCSYCDH